MLGTKPIIIDDWFAAMQTERRITVINTAADMEGNFPDLTLIRALCCNALISVPVMVGNSCSAPSMRSTPKASTRTQSSAGPPI
ncbi:MAG: hypothetical protein MO852_07540 [Candidatus Devosia euplotis]|nr:hypothetical protein [Candidatus Devosia euplotis]